MDNFNDQVHRESLHDWLDERESDRERELVKQDGERQRSESQRHVSLVKLHERSLARQYPHTGVSSDEP